MTWNNAVGFTSCPFSVNIFGIWRIETSDFVAQDLPYSFASLTAPACGAACIERSRDANTGHAATVEFQGAYSNYGLPEKVVVFAAKVLSQRVEEGRDRFGVGGAKGVVLMEDGLVFSTETEQTPTKFVGRSWFC